MSNNSSGGRSATAPAAAPDAASQDQRATSWFLPVVTALVLIALFCLYYFVYVKAQHEYLGNRNFRSLAALGDQLQTMVSIHGSILEFYADQDDKNRHGSEQHRKRVPLQEMLVVLPEDRDLEKPSQDQEAKKDYLKYLAPTFEWADPSKKKPSAPLLRLATQRHSGRWLLEFDARPESERSHRLPGVARARRSVPTADRLAALR